MKELAVKLAKYAKEKYPKTYREEGIHLLEEALGNLDIAGDLASTVDSVIQADEFRTVFMEELTGEKTFYASNGLTVTSNQSGVVYIVEDAFPVSNTVTLSSQDVEALKEFWNL